jgi:[acyl-carrier-protein] S-malonyltransferase
MTAGSDAVLFPGQGTHPPDMRPLVEGAPEMIDALVEECGHDVFERTDELSACRQPVFVAAALVGWMRLQRLVERGLVSWADRGPAAMAGHSLGELAALVAAGCLNPRDGLWVARQRGELYDEAEAAGLGGEMLAVLGESARAFAEGPEGADLWLANDNSPVQVVVAGRHDAIEQFHKAGRAAGLRIVPLEVTVPGHTPFLEPYVPRLRAALDAVEVHEPEVELWCCTTAEPMRDLRAEVSAGIVRPVRWRELLERLYAGGVRRLIDTGPGHVVAGLAYKTLEHVETPTVTDLEEIHA